MKKPASNQKPTPAPAMPAAELKVPVPSILKRLARLTPAEAMAQALSDLLGPPKNGMEGRAGLMSGLGLDIGLPVPVWAKEASRRFWSCCGLEFNAVNESGLTSAQLGLLAGLGEQPPQDLPTKLAKDSSDMVVFLKDVANKHGSPKEASEFFAARAHSGKTVEKMAQLPQRAKVFLCIAVAWKDVQGFQSAGELHRWLLDNKAILPQTDSADTRKVCREIGLDLREKAGRPPRKK